MPVFALTDICRFALRFCFTVAAVLPVRVPMITTQDIATYIRQDVHVAERLINMHAASTRTRTEYEATTSCTLLIQCAHISARYCGVMTRAPDAPSALFGIHPLTWQPLANIVVAVFLQHA